MRLDHIELRGGKYVVLSEDRSKELGTYDTEAEAKERLRQVEAAKAANDEDVHGLETRPGAPLTGAGESPVGGTSVRTDGRVRRYDTTEPITSIEESPVGGVRMKANFSRVGVFPYKYADGSTVREYRPPEEVHAPESIHTFKGAAVTDLHPSDQVDTKTFSTLNKGHVLDAAPNGPFVTGKLDVNDSALIDLIRSGQRKEVSCGYTADFDPTPGKTPDGQPYDGVQRNIRINHVALGPPGWGRQGPSVALRSDSRDAVATTLHAGKEPATHDRSCNLVASENIKMALKIKVDGVDCEAGSDTHISLLQKQIEANAKRADDAETKAKAEAKRAEDSAKLAEAEKKRADEAAAQTDAKAIAKRVAHRAGLITTARNALAYRARINRDSKALAAAHRYLDDDEEQAATSDDAIIIKAIQSLVPNYDPSGKSHDHLLGALDALCADKANETGVGEEDSKLAPPMDDDMEQDPGGEPLEPYDGLFTPQQTAPSGGTGTDHPITTPSTATPSVGNKKFGFDKGKNTAGDSRFAPRGQVGAPARMVSDNGDVVDTNGAGGARTQEQVLAERRRNDSKAWRQPLPQAVYAPGHPHYRAPVR